MVALKFAAVICLLYFTILVNAGKKQPTCKTVLTKLNKMESLCKGTFRNVFYLCIKRFKSVVFGHCRYINSEQQLTFMWFLWSCAQSDNCDGTDVCTAIKTLEMKLEAKLENLAALVENISPSPHPPPGKLGIIDLNCSSFYRFFVFCCCLFFLNVCFMIWIFFTYSLFLQGTVWQRVS